MTSQPGQQTIAIDILPNISQNKGKQTMKLGQLIVYNKKNFFFKKTVQKIKQGDQFQTSLFL